MSRLLGLVNRLYAALLRLYPRAFRDEFAAEMQAVFAQVSAESASQGRAALGVVCWRELRQAPANIVREHWQERSRRKMALPRDESAGFERISGLGVLATLTPFLFVAFFQMAPFLLPAGVSLRIGEMTAFLLVGGIALVMLFGLRRGLPAWSLPTMGFVGSFLALPGMAIWVWLFIFPSPLLEWLRTVLVPGLPSLTLILITLVALFILARVKPRHPFYERLRGDWTWLAFALYGSSAFWLWLTFDEYAGEQPYVFGAIATLMAGALIFLRARRPWLKIWTLLGSLLLVLLVVAWGKWTLVPVQTWPIPITEELRQGELQSTLQGGAWMILAVVGLPALLHFKLRRPRPAQPA